MGVRVSVEVCGVKEVRVRAEIAGELKWVWV